MPIPIHPPCNIKQPTGTPINRGNPLTQGLVGAWSFSEGAGLTAFTDSGLRNGTLIDSPTWSQTGLSFPGGTGGTSTKSRVECGTALVPTYTSDFTILSVITVGTIGVGGDDIIAGQCQSSGAVTAPARGLGVSSLSGRLKVYWNGGVIVNSPTGALVSNERCCLAAVFSGGTNAKGYKNGALLQNITVSGTPSVDGKFLIGAHYRQASNLYYGGFLGIAELVLVFNRALSSAEIASLSVNPWQIYEPEAQWVYINADGEAVSFTGTYAAAQAAQAQEITSSLEFAGYSIQSQITQSQIISTLLQFTGTTDQIQAANSEALAAALSFDCASIQTQPTQSQSAASQLLFGGTSDQNQLAQSESVAASLGFVGDIAQAQARQAQAIFQALLDITGIVDQSQAAQIASLSAALMFGGTSEQTQNSQAEALAAVLSFAGTGEQAQQAQTEALESLLSFGGDVSQEQLIQAAVLSAILAFSGDINQTQAQQRQIVTDLVQTLGIISFVRTRSLNNSASTRILVDTATTDRG